MADIAAERCLEPMVKDAPFPVEDLHATSHEIPVPSTDLFDPDTAEAASFALDDVTLILVEATLPADPSKKYRYCAAFTEIGSSSGGISEPQFEALIESTPGDWAPICRFADSDMAAWTVTSGRNEHFLLVISQGTTLSVFKRWTPWDGCEGAGGRT
ncbi:hypothetical protein [Citreimonas sp.]|uniref:hypothetical protein n=1 Tax=Citreimonas sp. TaxID=3036715 RepID=UPI0035C790B3